MKKITLLFSALIVACAMNAQTIVFHEDFETADSVASSGSPTWGQEGVLQVSGSFSYRNQVATSTASYLTTNAFSTIGNSFVLLDFEQICKIEFNDAGTVEVSNDNGTTWTQLTANEYLGVAAFATMGNRFASNSYSGAWVPGNNSAVPNNTWWWHEQFDISSLVSNAAQVKVRFKLSDINNNGSNSNYGWILDDVIVTASPSELNPPVIIQLNPILAGTVYSLGAFTINDSITDASGIASATLNYTVNNGPVQNVAMTNTSPDVWQGIIPAVSDSDTVCYSVTAVDASPAANTTNLPVSGCTQFIAFAGITFPFFDNFESTPLFTMSATNPGSVWQIGPPAYGVTTGAYSGSNAADINLTTGYQSNADAYLISPVFDFATTQNAKLSFWRNHWCEGYWDGTRVDYTTDGITWNVLGSVNDPNATNWYTNASLYSSGLPGWDGNSNGWVKSEYVLTLLNNVVGPVQFRFVFTSDGSVEYDGFSIDDFLIMNPFPQDASVTAVLYPDMSSCLPQGNVPLSIEVVNEGTQLITGFNLVYVLDNNAPVVEMYSDTIQPFMADSFTFTVPVNITAGTHTLVVYTQLTGDQWMFNDTISLTFFAAPSVSVPYVNDFENGATSLNDFCVINTMQGRVQALPQAANASAGGVAFDASNAFDWDFGTDTIPTSPMYIWDPANCNDQRANARLIINTTGYNDLALEFDAELRYAYSNEYTNFRVKVNGQMITPHLQPNFVTTPWTTYRYMLTSFLPAPFLIIDFESKVAYDVMVNGTGIFMDNLHIFKPDSLDAGVTQLTMPTGITIAANPTTVEVTIRNYGTSTLTAIPVAYQVNSNTPVIETWNGTLAPNASTTFTFATSYASPTGAYSLCTWTQLVGDSATWNDSVCSNQFGMSLFTIPFSDNFDGPVNWAANTTYPNSWELGNPVAPLIIGTHSGANAWEVDLNGPYQDNSEEYLYSPFFDFSNAVNIEMRFWQWYNNENFFDGGRIEYSANGGNTWTVLGVAFDPNGTNWYNESYLISSTLPGWSGNSGGYFQSKYNLSIFNNYPTPLQFRYVFTSDPSGSSTYDGWAIDDFELYKPDSLDAGVTLLNSPVGITIAGNPSTVSVTIHNYGTSTLTAIPVAYQINSNSPVIETWNGSLAPNANTTFTFATTYVSPTGAYNLCTWTQLVGDTATSNDSVCSSQFGMSMFTVPYVDNFDGTVNWAAVTTYPNSWELGSPSAPLITGTHSGVNAWEVNLNGPYQNNSNEYLYSPFFDFSNATNVELRFWQWYNCDNFYDGGRIEYSTNLGITWTVLGVAFDPNGTSWYNQSYLISSTLPGWSGNGGGYFQSKYNLAMFNNYPNPVQFRYVFTSDANVFATVDGWAIDDFELYMPIDAATNTIGFAPSPLPMPGTNNVKVNIKNAGLIPLNSVTATLKVDNTVVVTDPVTFSPALLPGASYTHTFSVPWTGASPAMHTVRTWTSLPNGYMDTYRPNDTTTWTLAVMDTFATYPWCNDFETANGVPPLTTMNAIRFTNSANDWMWGTPSKNIINNTHSGTKAWITHLTLNYMSFDTAGLFLPVFTVDTINCYHLEFWSRILTPINTDGGVVEYSHNNGTTWTRLGLAGEPNWYNLSLASGLGSGYQPNFGGTSNGWVKMQHDIKFSQAGPVIFRFRFGSDAGLNSEGWAIDDVCFTRIPPCVISVPEIQPESVYMQAFPNPAGTTTTLLYNLPEGGMVHIALNNTLGQTVASFEADQPQGTNSWTLDVSALANGVYFYELTFGGQRVVQKLVVSH